MSTLSLEREKAGRRIKGPATSHMKAKGHRVKHRAGLCGAGNAGRYIPL